MRLYLAFDAPPFSAPKVSSGAPVEQMSTTMKTVQVPFRNAGSRTWTGLHSAQSGACGICQSDSLVKGRDWPGLAYPRVPGHEVAGTVDSVGSDVAAWIAGDRVGIGWHGSHCG